MKNLKTLALSACCLCGLVIAAGAQSNDAGGAPTPDQTGAQAPTASPPADSTTGTAAVKQAEVPLPALAPRFRMPKNTGTNGLLTMNFRGAPLDMVLNYLIDAAGFVVLPETEIRGKVDVWSSHPVTKDEAVKLLDTVLRRNGYAAIREGQTLTICTLDDAKKKDIPVQTTRSPEDIAKDDAIVTMIIPVRSVNAQNAAKELAPLIANSAQLTADEAGNALIMTDSRANIKRVAEIIQKLDTASSSVNEIKVFPLNFEDAKTLAGVIKDLFPDANAQNSGRGGGGFNGFRGGRGGGGPGGFAAAMLGGAGGEASNAQARSPHVVATADDRSNSVIVSAPPELMDIIADVISNVDKPTTDLTIVRVFHLINSDPGEMVDLISNLFPDDTNQNENQNGRVRFGPFPFNFGGRGNNQAAQSSERVKKLSRVLAVADRRTASVIVSTSEELMKQIEPMIAKLDADKAHKFRTFVIQLTNTAPEDVVQVMQDLFPTSTRSTRMGSGTTAGSALTQRSTTLDQQNLQTSSQGGFSGSSFGSGRP